MHKLVVAGLALAGIAVATTGVQAQQTEAQQTSCAQEVSKLTEAHTQWVTGSVGSSGSPYLGRLQEAGEAAQAGDTARCMAIVEDLKRDFNRQGISIPG